MKIYEKIFFLSVESLFPKDRFAYGLPNEVRPCSAGYFLGLVTRLEYPLLLEKCFSFFALIFPEVMTVTADVFSLFEIVSVY